MREVYLDNAATTKPYQGVIEEMYSVYSRYYGNPSSTHMVGNAAKELVNVSRENLSKTISCFPEEIYFTFGGTESDNWALSILEPGDHLITSVIEHHAILNKCWALEKKGVNVTYIGVDNGGIVNPKDVENAITPNTKLISIMSANNEIGTIQPIREIGEIAHQNNIIFHTDAVQAYGHIPIDVNKLNIDMMSVSAHKVHGPKGIGFLYVKNGIDISPLIYGGGQEFGKRSGTENVPAIVGFGCIADIIVNLNNSKDTANILYLRNYFANKLLEEFDNVVINGDFNNRLPGNLNVCFKGCRGEQILRMLDMSGIYVSTGSACNSDSDEPSYVLKAIGLSDDDANASIRFSLDYETTQSDIDYVIDNLKLINNKGIKRK